MGIFNFLQNRMAKGPAITGTIDTIFNHYINLTTENPRISDQEIFKVLVDQRYAIMPLRDNNRYQTLLREIPNIKSLSELIFHILCVETELMETSKNYQTKVINTITEELNKKADKLK